MNFGLIGMMNVLADIVGERDSQNRNWGVQNHQPEWWMQILMEEVGEASKAVLEHRFGGTPLIEFRNEMIQVAAVAVAIVECFDRQYPELVKAGRGSNED